MADDDLRGEISRVEVALTERIAIVETTIELDGKRRDEQHDAVMQKLEKLSRDLSDQGRTPRPPPSLPPGPVPTTLPPGPTLEPATERSDPGEIRISPRRLTPWLDLAAKWARRLLLLGAGAGAHCASDHWPASTHEPTEQEP